ncbi:hypothetical protein [Acanthopleuribacter pedis]|uniref:Transmembrane protein n=1 Tax=Acanthopleuribacter pedis TaxID=442870 RepID=A0A8J7Q0S5_9BACT|nr:hypothetical protein [Acanthopleuribacter pedis]MBO1317109.1 hypothetical protein [Acanthopleuribacter pedis]
MRDSVAQWVGRYRRELFFGLWRRAYFFHSVWWLPAAACWVLGARLLQLTPGFGFFFLIALPVPMLTAWWAARRALPSSERLAADLDARYACGGLLLAHDQDGGESWADHLPEERVPKVSVRLGYSLPWTLVAWGFLAAMFLLPEVWFQTESAAPIMIQSQLVEKEQQINLLEEETLIERHEAEQLRKTLRQVRREAEQGNPAETWQALDAMQRTMDRQARTAFQNRKQNIEQAQMTAALGQRLNNSTLSDEAWQEAFEDYQQWTSDLRADNAVFDQAFSEVGDLKGLDRAEAGAKLVELSRVVKLSKEELEALRKRLKEGKLGDADTGVLVDGDLDGDEALAAYLAAAGSAPPSVRFLAPGGAGTSRGPGSVAIQWSGKTPDGKDPFEAVLLPEGASGRDNSSVRLAVGSEAPEADGRARSSGLDGRNVATGGTGSANRQQVLPRHRAAVGRYFERNDKER